MKNPYHIVILAVFAISTGCSQSPSLDTSETHAATPNIDATAFMLKAEPADAQDVIDVRNKAQDGDAVVIVGRIGGSKHPWVDGRAAFSIVDASLLACNDKEGDDCPYPWDYCCETDRLPTSRALVKFVDADGALLHAGARELFAVKELQTVVVSGKAQRDQAGNLAIIAHGLFVRD